jgi:hypothetical protein
LGLMDFVWIALEQVLIQHYQVGLLSHFK